MIRSFSSRLLRLRPTPSLLALIEAALIGTFFIQALRFLVGAIYTRAAGASTVLALQAIGAELPPSAPAPGPVQAEIAFLGYALLLPLIGLLFGRWRPLLLISVLIIAFGRAVMFENGTITPGAFTAVQGAALAVGGGLLYTALIIRHRASALPYLFVIGMAVDQILRAAGNSADPSLLPSYQPVQLGLSALAALISLIAALWSARRPAQTADRGLLPFWAGIGIGGLLFLHLSLLGVPNAAAGRAGAIDLYPIAVPLVLGATLLPLIPAVRGWARSFIGVFDGNLRGWLWLLLVVLLLVIGTRTAGFPALIALAAAQFAVTLVWWWLIRPRGEKERVAAGLWLLLGAGMFTLFVVMDLFTYDYAFVRDFTGDLAFLNPIIPPLLRGFRGLGLGVILLGAFFAVLPMTQNPRRIPWQGGPPLLSLAVFVIGMGAVAGASLAAQPPVVTAVFNVTELRVGTYNIHSGGDEFFTPTLPAIAATIQESGANIVLLQEVDAGRLTSFGVDQSLWLARRLGMDRRYFGTNEALHGLAILSNIPIAFHDGVPLVSLGQQTGAQRAQILVRPDVGITVYNTWLGYLFEAAGAGLEAQQQDQENQLRQLIGWIDTHFPNRAWGRLIVGGTFNNVPDSPLIESMRALGFRDPSAGLPLELSATLVRTGLPRARFDYVWLYNIDSLGPFTLPSPASDHRMTGAGVRIGGG
ncbi:MAG: endonuclease/exonuclease/phosphatase family protein [Anaerolinea sp.]|nr:endonuclease/exonuclease/phosphatase family protein [Anaerolinea sp.]